MTILNVLAPVFLLIALGVVLARIRFVSEAFLREANRVTYWLGLPALLFVSLAESFRAAENARLLLIVLALSTLSIIALAYLAVWLLRLPSTTWGTFVQGSFRGNLAYVGLPVLYALPAMNSPEGEAVRAAAVVTIAPMLVFYNCAAVISLIASQHKVALSTLKPLAKQLATTPPLLATLAGIGWAWFQWPMPKAVMQGLDWLGQMALPMALLGIGGALARIKLGRTWVAPAAAAAFKVLASPLLGFGLARLWGLSALETTAAALFLACPTAGISYTMVTQLNGDEEMASTTILFSTVTAVGVLALIVGLSG